jgi:predicted DNA-binding transcriptional regulator YafY
MGGAEATVRARTEPGASEIAVRSRVLPMSVPIHARAPLEIIRFAAANHLCVDLTYDGSVRRIEPYSLRQTTEGNFVLHAIRCDSGDHRSYRVDRIQGTSVSEQSFTPRYLVELTSEGPLLATAAALPYAEPKVTRSIRTPSRLHAAVASRADGPVYVYRCTVCSKTLQRKSMNSLLNPHKDPRSDKCPGRTGVYVRTKY